MIAGSKDTVTKKGRNVDLEIADMKLDLREMNQKLDLMLGKMDRALAKPFIPWKLILLCEYELRLRVRRNSTNSSANLI
ncbi:MAG: hypothetical protein JWN49_84 [Parcubacteria group bacterium]|nr:hypothetical protein [Parcubacteria group bacterium]